MKDWAISRWPLTPCSRNMATRGRLPAPTAGVATGYRGFTGGVVVQPGVVPAAQLFIFLGGAVGVVAQFLDAIAGFMPQGGQLGHWAVKNRFAVKGNAVFGGVGRRADVVH